MQPLTSESVKVGDLFVVTGSDGIIVENGSVIQLIEKDGSYIPGFQLVEGNMSNDFSGYEDHFYFPLIKCVKLYKSKQSRKKVHKIPQTSTRIEILYDDGSTYTIRTVEDWNVDEFELHVSYEKMVDGFIQQFIEEHIPVERIAAYTVHLPDGFKEVQIFNDQAVMEISLKQKESESIKNLTQWQEWDGCGRPVENHVVVDVVLRCDIDSGEIITDEAGCFRWNHALTDNDGAPSADIVKWRLNPVRTKEDFLC